MDKDNHSSSIALEQCIPHTYRARGELPIITILFIFLNNKYINPSIKVPRHHPFAYYQYNAFLKNLWKLCPLWGYPLGISNSGNPSFGMLWKSLGRFISIGSID